jgi:glycosyltransferase involved in cell wall biosynthesis
VAVIIPCWNAQQWIARAIESVLNQNYPDFEIIVIDDGSIDKSLEIIKSFGNRVRWETGPNSGACAARNRGLSLSTAKYVLFLDADDYLDEGYLSHLGNVLRTDIYDLVLTSYAVEHADRSRSSVQRPPASSSLELMVSACLAGWSGWVQWTTFTSSMVFSSEFIKRIGSWNESVAVLQDFEIGLRAVLKNPRVGFSPESVAIYVQHESETRVSNRIRGTAAWQTVFSFLEALADQIKSHDHPEISRRYGYLYYHVARKLYQAGWLQCGDEALRRARTFGFHEHIGSGKDLIMIKCVGLRNRELVGLIKRRIVLLVRRAFTSPSWGLLERVLGGSTR